MAALAALAVSVAKPGEFRDITLAPMGAKTTVVVLNNALGSKVAKHNLPGCGDFNVLGVPVEVKMPVDMVRRLIAKKGATVRSDGQVGFAPTGTVHDGGKRVYVKS
ncbi:MAG: hypothetical protein JSS66_05615 [Armatimonadetes bacterium]|nr:hypothetical protein [Armatimonadota bacterium]